jgi:hypothetical protein
VLGEPAGGAVAFAGVTGAGGGERAGAGELSGGDKGEADGGDRDPADRAVVRRLESR